MNWGRAPAHQFKRIPVDAGGTNKRLPDFADWVGRQRWVSQAFDKGRRLPVTGTSCISGFNGKHQVDLAVLGDVIASRAMDLYSQNSPFAWEVQDARGGSGCLCGRADHSFWSTSNFSE